MAHARQGRARILGIGLVAVLVVGGCDDDTASPNTDASAPVTEGSAPGGDDGEAGFTFGWVRPASGLLSDLAAAQQTAMSLAVEDINAAGGVNGEPVAVVTVDEPTSGDFTGALGDLLDQGVNMVLGPISSDQSLAALDTLATRSSVACSASATSPQLTTADTSNVFYRTAMPDSVTVDFVADTIEADAAAAGLPEGETYEVVVVAREDDYGINAGNGLTSALLARGIGADVVSYNPRQVTFLAEADAIVAADPDAVVLVAYAEATRQVDQLVDAGLPVERLIGLDGVFNPSLGERSFPSDPSRIGGMRVIGATGGRAFVDRLIEDETSTQIIYGAQMYDCMLLGALAASSAGSSDAAAFAPELIPVSEDGRACSTYADCLTQLEAGDDIDYQGQSGGVYFDAAGDPSEVRMTVAAFEGADLREVSSTDIDLEDVRQQEAIAAAVFTSRLQQLLTALGYYSGPIDGQWSDELTASLVLLQTDLGVPATGVYDEATDAALRARYGELTGLLDQSIADLQVLLTNLGFYSGPIDGIYSRETVEAVKALQAALGVPQTGIVDAATLQAAYEAGLASGQPPPSTSVPPETTVPPATTQPPSTTAPITPPDPSDPTMLEALRADPQFSMLVELIESAGFASDTEVLGPLTLFAPTNDALSALPPEDLEALRNDPTRLQQALAYHLVEAALTLDDLAVISDVRNVYGDVLSITVDGEVVAINGVETIAPDIECSNGIIVPLNGILLPPD